MKHIYYKLMPPNDGDFFRKTNGLLQSQRRILATSTTNFTPLRLQICRSRWTINGSQTHL